MSEPRDVLPLIRWAGSKRAIAWRIASLAPAKFQTYFEPFCGSACVFFQLRPARGIISDVNSELIGAYNVAVRDTRRLYEALLSLPTWKPMYYRIRAMAVTDLSPFERAVRFFYLNRFCFNGVYRTNRKGEFNVPRGRDTGGFPTWDQFRTSAKLLRGSTILSADFGSVLESAKKGDFVYLDPPYVNRKHVEFGQYGYDALHIGDLPRLVSILDRLDRRGVRFLLSYTVSPMLVANVPQAWKRQITVNRNVAGFAGKRKSARELLIANYRPLA